MTRWFDPALRQSRGFRYLVSFVAVGTAISIRLVLQITLDDESAFTLFGLAVMLAAWYGGLGPGLLATALSAAAGTYLFLEPFKSLSIEAANRGGLQVLLLSIEGAGISCLARALHQAKLRAEAGARQLREILDSISDGFHALDRELHFVYVNAAAERMMGQARDSLIGRSVSEAPRLFGDTALSNFRMAAAERQMISFESYYAPWQTWYDVSAYPSRDGVSVYFKDITAKKNAEREREALIQELSSALSNVKTLSGLLPICAACKRIRDDRGYWHQVENYIRDHSAVMFSHGVCPECLERLYPEWGE